MKFQKSSREFTLSMWSLERAMFHIKQEADLGLNALFSSHLLEQGSANEGPQTKSGKLPIFVNKAIVLLVFRTAAFI